MANVVTCVVCSYNLPPRHLHEKLERIAKKIGVSLSGVIVVNRADFDLDPIPGWRVVRGTNDTMDFSAYYEGIRSLAAPLEGHCLLVLNDTVFTDHHAYWNIKETLKYRIFVGQVDRPCIAGKVDDYPSICFSNPWSGLNAYVSSYCFLLNQEGARTFEQVYERLPDELPDGNISVQDPQWGTHLDPALRHYLRLHLTTDYDPNSWYKANHYHRSSDILKKKARCVYLEHRLSGEIGKSGIIIATNAWAKSKIKLFLMERTHKIFRMLST